MDVRCRRLHGRRGLKFGIMRPIRKAPGRRLHGRRGLKSLRKVADDVCAVVAAFTGGVD